MCSGITPALTPNPTRNSRKTAACQAPVNLEDVAAKLEKSRLPDNEFKSKKPISKHPVPACDMTKNKTPACRVVSCRCSKVIRQYAASAITSQAIRKKNAFDAVKTAVRLNKDRL